MFDPMLWWLAPVVPAFVLWWIYDGRGHSTREVMINVVLAFVPFLNVVMILCLAVFLIDEWLHGN